MKTPVVILGLIAVLLGGGCEDETQRTVLPKSADPVVPSTSATMRARTRSYFVGNVDGVCTVFWEEGLRVSTKKEVPCPREIDTGERIRLTGRTCTREAHKAGRNVPVRCPKHIFYVERDDRKGRGEFKLGAHK